jgi:D123
MAAPDRTELFAPDDYLRLETYIDDIAELTFDTVTLDLPESRCHALAKAREAVMMIAQSRRLTDDPELTERDPRSFLSQEDNDSIDALEGDIDAALDVWRREDEGNGVEFAGAFVKLSTRSPKDAALRMPELYDMMEHDLGEQFPEEKVAEVSYEEWVTAALATFTHRGVSVLKIERGSEAVRLFLASQRVFEDITNLKLLQQKNFEMKLVLRRWWADISPQWEFRGFASNGVLHAVTQ